MAQALLYSLGLGFNRFNKRDYAYTFLLTQCRDRSIDQCNEILGQLGIEQKNTGLVLICRRKVTKRKKKLINICFMHVESSACIFLFHIFFTCSVKNHTCLSRFFATLKFVFEKIPYFMRLSVSTCHVISNRLIFHYNPVHKLRGLKIQILEDTYMKLSEVVFDFNETF